MKMVTLDLIEKLVNNGDFDLALKHLLELNKNDKSIRNTQYYYLLGIIQFYRTETFTLNEIFKTLKKGKKKKTNLKYLNKIYHLLGDIYKELYRENKYKNKARINSVIKCYYSRVDFSQLNDEEKYDLIKSKLDFMELCDINSHKIIDYLIKNIGKLNKNKYLLMSDISDIYNYDLHDYIKAIEYNKLSLKNIKNDDIKKGDILLSLGMIYQELNKFNESNEYLYNSLKIFKNKNDKDSFKYCEIIYRNLANNLEENGNLKQAIEYFKFAMEYSKKADTDVGKNLYFIADRYDDYNDKVKAIEYGLEAIELIQDSTYKILDLKLLGRVYSEINEYKKSIKSYLAIIKQFPEYEELYDIYFRIGRVYYENEKYIDSIQNLNEAIKNLNTELVDYDNLFIRYNCWIGRCYFDQGQYDNSIDICNELIEKYENNVSILFPIWLLADCYLEKGLNVQAKNTLEKALDIYSKAKSITNLDKIHYNNVEEVKKEVYKELGILE